MDSTSWDDGELLQAVLGVDEAGEDDDPSLSVREREAFASMLAGLGDGGALSDKQRAWVHSAAVRLRVLGSAPAANVFSSMSPSEQRLHRRRAESVQLPWEREGYVKPAKPPGPRR